MRIPDSHTSQHQLPAPSRMSIQSPAHAQAQLALRSMTVGRILVGMFIVWAVLVVLTVVIAATSKMQAALLALLTLGVTGLFVAGAFSLMFAKKRAMRYGQAHAWFGLIGIVAWDPNQGVLFLKDKTIAFVDSNPHDGGGVLLVLPWLGEEIAFRAPLETRTTKFLDRDVLTREYVPVTVKGAIFWRIVDLERFYLTVSRSIHEVTDRGGHRVVRDYDEGDVVGHGHNDLNTARQIEAGEEWLRMEAEQRTREVVLTARTGLLVGDKIVEGLPAEMQSLVMEKEYKDAADQLAGKIRKGIEAVGIEHGIEVDRVSLQEFELAPAILKAAVSACVSAYQPLIAQREAAATKMHRQADAYGRKEMLKGEAEVIGSDAVAKREVLGGVQPFAFGGRTAGIGGVLDQFFVNDFVDSPGTQNERGLSKTVESTGRVDNPFSFHGTSTTDDEPVFEDDEEAAKRQLNRAKDLYNAGEIDKAVATLEGIVRLYGNTRAGDVAAKNVETMRRRNARGGPA